MNDGISFEPHDAFFPLRFDLTDDLEREAWAIDAAKVWRTVMRFPVDWGREQVLAAQLLLLADRQEKPVLSYAVAPDLAKAALGSFDVEVLDSDDLDEATAELLEGNHGVVAEPEITISETAAGTATRVRERILLDVDNVVFSRTSYLALAPAEVGGVVICMFLTPDLTDAEMVLPQLDQFVSGLHVA